MKTNDPQLVEIWNQISIPILVRREQGYPLLVRLPNSAYYQDWLRGGKQRIPEWNFRYECWQVPVAWFDELIKHLIDSYGQIYVIQVYREYQRCAPACWNARGFHCECSCMGANHGNGYPGGMWHIVSDAFAIQWEERKYSCRLITKRTQN